MRVIILPVLFLLNLISSYGQVIVGKPALVKTQPLQAFGVPTQSKVNWDITLTNYSSFDHAASVPKEEFNKLKAAVNEKRDHSSTSINQSNSINRNSAIAPVMRVNFQGNIQGNNVPPDNAMAVSTNGFIVSAINSNIIFANSAGNVTFTQNLADFFTFVGNISSVYDPRILFDVVNKRFIVLSLNGSSPSNTKILVAFSKHEDPAAGWNYYSFDGNPLGDNNWFDYPNVGLTDNNLFFSGLMRNDDGLWQYSVIYQIDKIKCFAGQETQWSYYSEVNNADGEKAFNLVPTHSAWNTYPDSKMHFISNVANGGDQYHLHYIDGNVGAELPIFAHQITGPQTELAPDGKQPNTTKVMNTFDSRIWGAMELNGIIHFGAHVNSPENTSGIFYGRYNIAANTVKGQLYYHKDFDYGFPSIATLGNNESSDTVLINMLKTGKTLFPSQVAVLCSGLDNEFNFSNEVTTKEGTGFVSVLQDNRERWGDYTTVGRRFYQDAPEVWITGCFGKGTYGTWIAQYFADSTKNIVDFIADKTTLNPGQKATFSVLSNSNYTLLEWKINNGSEVITQDANPQITFNNLGQYDATIVVRHAGGNIITITKPSFITVIEKALAPVANFSADRDTIYQGESVQFMDESINDPLAYSWNFTNGIPTSSNEKNPLIKYEKVGSFLVNLSVRNTAGNDNEIKQKFITVLKAIKPIANFGSNVTEGPAGSQIFFFDNSANVPLSWQWQFEGGEPSESTSANPLVTYPQDGIFNVTLVVSNFAGSDTIINENYIQIGETSIKDLDVFEQIQLFPNPVLNGSVTVKFELKEKDNLEVRLFNESGQLVKTIIDQKVKAGINELKFNSDMLISGQYFVNLKSKNSYQTKTLSFQKL